MPIIYRRIACSVALLLCAAMPTIAQTADTTAVHADSLKSGLTIGLSAGVNQLYGDLSSPNIRPTFGLLVSYPVSKIVNLNLLGDLGTLSAQESSFYNSVAKTSFAQVALGGSINLTSLFQRAEKRKLASTKSSLSLYLAVGMISFDATAYSLTTNLLQRYTNGSGSHRTESDGVTAKGSAGILSTHEIVVPIGLRYNRQLSSRINLYGDLRYTFVNTDKLDASVDNDNTTISVPNGGDIYRNPASGESRDAWASLSIGLSYRLGKRQ